MRKQLNSLMQKVDVSRENQLALVIDEISGRGRILAPVRALRSAE